VTCITVAFVGQFDFILEDFIALFLQWISPVMQHYLLSSALTAGARE
jgi:hypothetical protein